MKKPSKKKFLVLAAAALMLTATVSGTLAYFTDSTTAHNVITSGGVNIQIIEEMDENGTLVEFPENGLTGIMPGTEASKIVTIKNTGASTAWIRASVEVKVTGSDGKELSNAPISYNYADGDWVADKEIKNLYYYSEPVDSDKSTSTLFKKVVFDKSMDNKYQGCTVQIIVNAEAVQTANNPIKNDDITSVWSDSDGKPIEILPEKPDGKPDSGTSGAGSTDPVPGVSGGDTPAEPAEPADPDTPADPTTGTED